MTSQVVQIILIVFEKQCTFHHLHVYEFDWMHEWCQASWKIVSLRVDLMFFKSRELNIDFESWLHLELDNQCKIVVLCSVSLQTVSEMQMKNDLIE